jgi:acyl-CoA thioester hydrolase
MSEWPDLAGRIVGGTHVLPIRVYYEDTDFSGIVYHANYLRFAERGRSDFLRLAGISHAALFMGEERLAFAVHHMDIDFLKPARIDELLEVHTRFLELGKVRLIAEQVILRPGAGEQSDTLWKALVHIACLDAEGRPRRLPPEVFGLLSAFGPAEEGKHL